MGLAWQRLPAECAEAYEGRGIYYLDIVQRIVAQQHGGRVDVESEPGRTVFSVWLPIDPDVAADEAERDRALCGGGR